MTDWETCDFCIDARSLILARGFEVHLLFHKRSSTYILFILFSSSRTLRINLVRRKHSFNNSKESWEIHVQLHPLYQQVVKFQDKAYNISYLIETHEAIFPSSLVPLRRDDDLINLTKIFKELVHISCSHAIRKLCEENNF